MAERLPPGVYESEDIRPVYSPSGDDPHIAHHSSFNGEHQPNSASIAPNVLLTTATNSNHTNGISPPNFGSPDARETNQLSTIFQNEGIVDSHGTGEHLNTRDRENNGDINASSKGREHIQNSENGSKTRSPTSTSNQVEAEWIEQYEPGVYITLMALRDGTRDLKRVRFSRRRFGEHQAEAWWSENREKVYEKYNVRGSDRASSAASTQSARRSVEDFMSSSRV